MKIFRNKNFIVIFGLSLGFLVLAAGVAFVRLAEIKTPLIIHFDAFKGIDFLGDRFDVSSILIVALVIVLINFFLAEFIFDRQRFLSFVFAYVSLAMSALTFIATVVIISIN
ncbi:MAG: hypothetical protein WC475_04055 [Candidatus Paceibacterota bacterium]